MLSRQSAQTARRGSQQQVSLSSRCPPTMLPLPNAGKPAAPSALSVCLLKIDIFNTPELKEFNIL